MIQTITETLQWEVNIRKPDNLQASIVKKSAEEEPILPIIKNKALEELKQATKQKKCITIIATEHFPDNQKHN